MTHSLSASDQWHSSNISDIFEKLETSQNGLSKEEARRRLQKNGPNIFLEEKKFHRGKIFLAQLQSPLIFVLFVATIISFIFGEFIDAVIIFLAVFFNTFLGYIQENKANKAIQKLQSYISYRAKVYRDGHLQELPQENIVVGDVVRVEAGDRINADGRILFAKNAAVVEALLTGESEPSIKGENILLAESSLSDRENMVFLGTVIERGRILFVVTATGKNTELGKISRLLQSVKEEETPLQRQLKHLSKFIGGIVGSISLFIFLFGLFVGADALEFFLIAVAVAVSAIPEGLAISITVILAIGMQRILHAQALTRRLIAAETLGSVSVICTDKTGTLTEGEMRVDTFIVAKEGDEFFQRVLEGFVLCNEAIVVSSSSHGEDGNILGSSTERALILKARESGADIESIRKRYLLLDEKAFTHEEKFMAVLYRKPESGNIIFVKGAPEKILSWCDFSGNRREELIQKTEYLTRQGFRVLALAQQETLDVFLSDRKFSHLTFLCLVALKDPLRNDICETLSETKKAGIRAIMVTGDHRLTAYSIAREAGFEVYEKNVLEGADLDVMSDEELFKKVTDIQIYARVTPEHKLRIIDAWQKRGEVVAMTGDGVNDAPALKKADVGIALGSGTDVAKQASDIVLLKNNFRVILMAIQEGRIIFANIRKVLTYLLSDSFSETILIVGSLFLGTPTPLLVSQILWINLLNDGLPSMALSFEKGEHGIMLEPPRKRNTAIVTRSMKYIIFGMSIVMDVLLFFIFWFLLQKGGSLDYLRTIMFTAIAANSLICIFSLRDLGRPLFRIPFFSNSYLFGALGISFLFQLLAIYVPLFQNIFHTVPLGVFEWTLIIGLGIIKIIGIEFIKYFFREK